MTSPTKASAPASPPKDSALEFHNRLIAEKGVEDASGFSRESRYKRFSVIGRCLEEFPAEVLKVLDYGCNDGELYEMLGSHSKPCYRYTGMDINPNLIRWARKRWKCRRVLPQNLRFSVGNILNDNTYEQVLHMRVDVIIASGVLSYKADAPTYPELLSRLFLCAQKGVIFNVLAADVPKNLIVRTPGVLRWKPEKLLQLIRHCHCASWELIRSYLHNDITVVLRKNWTHFAPQ